MYANGEGVAQNYVRAYMWFQIAAGSSEAEMRQIAIKNRDRAASLMTPSQIAQAQKLAAEWTPK